MSALLLVLGICSLYTLTILSFKRMDMAPALKGLATVVSGLAFEQFVSARLPGGESHIQADAPYSEALITELSIADACRRYALDRGELPTLVTQLAPYGISPASGTDPWGHPYRLRRISSNSILVQAIGPSGMDHMRSSADVERVSKKLDARAAALEGDNLIIRAECTSR
jgi:hypothetical protein